MKDGRRKGLENVISMGREHQVEINRSSLSVRSFGFSHFSSWMYLADSSGWCFSAVLSPRATGWKAEGGTVSVPGPEEAS